jgi:hypothetical protein
MLPKTFWRWRDKVLNLCRVSVGLAALMCSLVVGCSIQPPPRPMPPTAEDIIWMPSSDAGKTLRSRLYNELEALVRAVRASTDLPRLEFCEPGVSIVRFRESGKKQGLELRFFVVATQGQDYSAKARHVAAVYIQPLVALITQHPSITASDEIDCIMIVFEWEAGVESQQTLHIPTYPPERSTTLVLPKRSVITESMIVEIPKMLIRRLAEGDPDSNGFAEFVKAEARYDRL